MRFLVIGLTAALLALPAATPASACAVHTAKAAATDYSAAKKKPAKMAKKTVKKKKKAKVEYMRAVPYK
jgi:hypothetical protein